MRRLFTNSFLLLALCILPLTMHAQKQNSLVTNEMAQKIAWYSQFGNDYIRATIYNDFTIANRMSSLMEYDKTMSDIVNHKDKVEKFICQVFYSWGTENFGYSYFKSIGYTIPEYETALKIYNKWEEEREAARQKEEARKQEEERQLKLQQAAIDRDSLIAWERNGKPVFDLDAPGITAPTFIIDIDGYGDAPIIEPRMQTNQTSKKKSNAGRMVGEPPWIYNSFQCRNDEITADEVFYFIVGKDTNIEYTTKNYNKTKYPEVFYNYELDSTNALLDHLNNVYIISPGSYTFSGLDTTISVPTRNYIRVVEEHRVVKYRNTELEKEFTKLEVVVVRNKATQQWTLKSSDEKKVRKWFTRFQPNNLYAWKKPMKWLLCVEDVDEFIGMLNAQINNNLLWSNHKKCRLYLTIVGCGERFYYINNYKLEETTYIPFEAKIDQVEILK